MWVGEAASFFITPPGVLGGFLKVSQFDFGHMSTKQNYHVCVCVFLGGISKLLFCDYEFIKFCFYEGFTVSQLSDDGSFSFFVGVPNRFF